MPASAAGPDEATPRHEDLPSSVTPEVSVFDRFAAAAAVGVSRPVFFASCVLLVVLWAPTYFLFPSADTWQLVVNTVTSVVTFLLVALLQNGQRRSDAATQHKLNAIAEALADLMSSVAHDHPMRDQIHRDLVELRDAVGLEHHESA